MTTTTRRVATPPAMRARDFSGSAVRLVKLLAPQRRTAVAVTALSVAGTAIGVVVPRILGHATDLLFNGVIGRRLPAGITKDQAVAAARAHGDNAFADLLSGMHVIPGHGVDFGAVVADTGAGAWHVSGCRADDLRAGPAAQRDGAADPAGAALAESKTKYTDCRWPTSTLDDEARCSAGSPTTSTTFKRRCR